MEKESPRQRLVEVNSTGGQGSQRAAEPGGGGYLWDKSQGVRKSRTSNTVVNRSCDTQKTYSVC